MRSSSDPCRKPHFSRLDHLPHACFIDEANRCRRQHPGSQDLQGCAALRWFKLSALSIRQRARSPYPFGDGCLFYYCAGSSVPIYSLQSRSGITPCPSLKCLHSETGSQNTSAANAVHGLPRLHPMTTRLTKAVLPLRSSATGCQRSAVWST